MIFLLTRWIRGNFFGTLRVCGDGDARGTAGNEFSTPPVRIRRARTRSPTRGRTVTATAPPRSTAETPSSTSGLCVRTSEQPGRSIAPPISDAELVNLRLRYQTAYDAYQACVFALEKDWRPGDEPAPELLARHAETLRRLNEERARYRDTLMQAAFLSPDSAPAASMAHELQSPAPWGLRSKQPG